MGKSWRDRQRRGVQASSGKTAVVSKENFTAPTSGLEKLTFSRGTTIDAARFKDTLDKLAPHVGTWNVYGAANAAKEMKDMEEPVFMRPVRSSSKYYKFWTEQQISDHNPMVNTSNWFTKRTVKHQDCGQRRVENRPGAVHGHTEEVRDGSGRLD